MNNNRFLLNEAFKGGAIYVHDSPKLTLMDNEFAYNRACRGNYFTVEDPKYLENITSSGGALEIHYS